MSEDDRKPSLAFWITVLLSGVVVLLGAYSGAYVALAQERNSNTFGPGSRRPYVRYCSDDLETYPAYTPATTREILLDRFFQPAHWVDQHLVRPGYWSY
jgi:hypothetical protein